MISLNHAAITVYCGASAGVRPEYAQAATDLGRQIAARGHALVYGGGSRGLMGIVADAVLAGGGRVVGVIPDAMVERELAHDGLTELVRVEDMHVRKRIMIERGDAFVALPGGIGTLEEIVEVVSWAQLAIHRKPFGLVNTLGYYAPLLACLDHMVEEGFFPAPSRAMIRDAAGPSELLDALSRPFDVHERWT